MPDLRFYNKVGPFSISQLAKISDSAIFFPDNNKKNVDNLIYDVAILNVAKDNEVSFLHSNKYVNDFYQTKAGVCIVDKNFMLNKAPSTTCLLLSNNPYLAYAKLAKAYYPVQCSILPEDISGNLHSVNIIHPSSNIAKDCIIEPGVIIGENVKIGRNTQIGANSIIGKGVVIGDDSIIETNCTISYGILGNNVVISHGVKIGQSGFGFVMSEKGHITVPQLGRVIIENNVEIGANSTIDRGSLGDTIVGEGTRIDNLVQVGHNVNIGKKCVIAAQAGIAGSTCIGDFTVVAGQVGISGHLRIGKRVQIAAQSGVIRDVKDGEKVGGTPAVPIKNWHRQSVILSRLIKKNN